MKYRKKPVVIEAMQLKNDNVSKVLEWVNSFNGKAISSGGYDNNDNPFLVIETLEGQHLGLENDFIIRGIKDEVYPCKPDIFEMTYEMVQDE